MNQVADLLSNPGFESWSSPTDCDNWSEVSQGGTSSLDREDSQQRSGDYCIRFAVDGDGNDVLASQSHALMADATYGLSLYIMGAVGGESPQINVRQNFESNLFLQDDGSWPRSQTRTFQWTT